MSEIILEYSGYLLNKVHSQEEKKEIITLAVIAWNISLSKEDT